MAMPNLLLGGVIIGVSSCYYAKCVQELEMWVGFTHGKVWNECLVLKDNKYSWTSKWTGVQLPSAGRQSKL